MVFRLARQSRRFLGTSWTNHVTIQMAPPSTAESRREATMALWPRADAVCFDVDSTVIVDEGIDELAEFCGVGREVQDLTARAMGGSVSFREALEDRLNIIRPSQAIVKKFIVERSPKLTPGIQELVRILQTRGVSVYLVSGGFHELIDPVARILNIPTENVYANRFYFLMDGSYGSFDKDQPTSESGGKGRVIQKLKKECGYGRLFMIGDGATDLEACPPADGFIGFGGNRIRQKVKDGAPWFITDFKQLTDALQ